MTRLNRQVEVLDARVRDIPLVEVMSKLGYRGEHDSKAKSSVYRDAQGRAALIITDSKATRGNEIVARNAVDLVIHVREAHERIPTTAREVTLWLAEAFGKNRAVAATLVRAEQGAMVIVHEHERSRDMETRREPVREMPSRCRIAQLGNNGFQFSVVTAGAISNAFASAILRSTSVTSSS